MPCEAPIGIFDSGYGGLTVFEKIRERLPEHDFLYLGDNARTPYGTRSFEIVYEFTKQAVFRLFDEGCPLVILACNTASAKALRTIQQNDLPRSKDPTRRVLGVIRPTVEALKSVSKNMHVGVLATAGTVASRSYSLEIAKLFPEAKITEEACPMWVPLVENRETDSPAAEYFMKKNIDEIFRRDPEIDTLVLGCTHYPLLLPALQKCVPASVKIFPQGECVAESLADYLARHGEMDSRISRHGSERFLTTESAEKFVESASVFLNGFSLSVETITL
ncbi:MAG: glutamate racemase [Opitutae bacterium]|nr:glutamate racemase [Opitutae bacterium]